MASIIHNRPNNRIQDNTFDSIDFSQSRNGYETTNFDMSAYNNTTILNENTNNNNNKYPTIPIIRRNPRLSRGKSRENKIYRTPPTPTPDKLIIKERSFKLDCIAVGNISEDYSTANPKLGSAIQP